MQTPCTIEQAVDQVLAKLEGPIRLGLPLGLGKPNQWVNALYARLKQLPERQLVIYTALCLGRPPLGSGLSRRFLEPFVQRVYGDYPELDFLADLRRDCLPANVRVEQFFLQPGSLLDSTTTQQNYISSNYSHVARDLNDKGLNLIAQLVAQDPQRPEHFSLSCNPDITLDLLPLLAGVGTALLALPLGWLSTRRPGTPFAMITLGVGELVWALALMWPAWSGGEAGLSGNRGAEAMARFADGRTIVFSEDADDDPRGREALLFAGDPAASGPPPRFSSAASASLRRKLL